VRAVYTLLVGGILEEVTNQERSLVEENTGTFLMAVAAAAATPIETGFETETPIADLREQIIRLYEALPRATHYAVLGVAPDAEDSAVDGAYRRLVSEQDRLWQDMVGDLQMNSVLSTIRLRRREAYQVLSDPIRRSAYDQALGGLAPPKVRASAPPEEHSYALNLLRQARSFIEQSNRDAAIPLLLEAVDREPGERTCRRLLALTLAQHPTLFRTAERHFLAALEQDPHDVDLRYRLAVYYRKVGLPTRAMAQLNVVLNQDSRHHSAQRDLEALQAETGLRKRR
jgi:hypothetical protein